jgi:hypothetical protein
MKGIKIGVELFECYVTYQSLIYLSRNVIHNSNLHVVRASSTPLCCLLHFNILSSPRRPGFAPGSIHVGFVVDKVAVGQVFLRVLRFSPVII